MNNSEAILKLIGGWADKVGRREAKRRLIVEGIGISTAEQLVLGRYKSAPGELVTGKVLRAMARDQNTSRNGEAS